ncbi:MAG: hypothetical protein Q9172_005056 [Xanthocarpia lactea]
MGNSLSAPRQRSRAVYTFREGTEEEIRNLIRSLRDEADVNTRVGQQKYERRERQYRAGGRPRHPAGRDRSTSGDGMRRERFFTAPMPRQFGSQDMGNSGYLPHRGRSDNRRGPPRGYGGGRPRYETGREEPRLNEDMEDVEYEARDLADQYAGLDPQAPIQPQPHRPRRNPDEPDPH